jgi:superfamily II DNA or RNA helicase
MSKSDPLPRTALHPYQTDGAASLLSDDGRQLVAIMGAGKTIVALTAIADLQVVNALGDGIVAVVGPLAVVQSVWHREAASWAHTRHLRIERVLGTIQQRNAALDRPTDIYVVNYDNIRWFAEEITKRGLSIALLIADEASCLKTPSARRTRTMIELGHRAARRWALTGMGTDRHAAQSHAARRLGSSAVSHPGADLPALRALA